MLTPEKETEIRYEAAIHGRDPEAAVVIYETMLENVREAQKQARLEIWQKLGRSSRQHLSQNG
jgi:hypothetical protein